jgi:hypothetical protein
MSTIKLNNVRLSFPHLWKAQAPNENAEPRFSAVLLLDEKTHAREIKQIETVIAELAAEMKVKPAKLRSAPLYNGEDKTNDDGDYFDGYGPGIRYLNTANKTRIPVVDRNPGVALAEEDGRPYAGCYVNASVSLWKYDNNWGKGVSAQLNAIQFHHDGEPFGAGRVDPEEEFEDLSADEEEMLA